MANRAVFMDRDHTLIEDPGYVNDPALVKLLPGVDLALKWLAQAGYLVIAVTNQSGVARGLITEAQLEQVHQELRRQLQEKGARLDAIYYCPYHPEGTVERYAIESDLRKPEPGMLLKAAAQWDLDLGSCWMVGDAARDIEAGQRAGCRTIRLRSGHEDHEQEIQAAQADYTARNLVEAAKIVLQQDRQEAKPPAAPGQAVPPSLAKADQPERPAAAGPADRLDDQAFRRELLGYVRQIARADGHQEFNLARLLGGIVQVLTLLGLVMTFWGIIDAQTSQALMWGQVTLIGQMLALTLFVLARQR
jgi:D,D-heptose 1,7-bisphosphate phosphatase